MTPVARPQTIQIFQPLGDPRGIRIAEITTRIVQLIEVPRPQLVSSTPAAPAPTPAANTPPRVSSY